MKKINIFGLISLIQFIAYAAFSSYGYYYNDKFAIFWFFLALLCLANYIIKSIKEK